MKSLYTYIGAVLAAASILASCDKNEPSKFNDKDAFVAFDKTSLTLSEGSEDVLKIPVTLASVAGLEETIKFEIKAGSENTCTVTVSDIDHPLGFMLGEYTATGVNQWNGPCTWTMTFFKDADDDHKVWIDNLFQNDSWAGEDTRYYGIVNEDLTSLNIPFGQESEYKYSNGNPITLLGFDGENGYDTGSVDVAITRDGNKVSLDFGTEWGVWVWIEGAGNLNIVKPGITAVKK